MYRALKGLLALSLLVACSSGNSDNSSQRPVTQTDASEATATDSGPGIAPEADATTSVVDASPAGPACGDGRLDPGEACDEGARNGRNEAGACRSDCTLPRCGDERVDPGEACDTGALLSDVVSDACRTGCRATRCGDGVVDRGEDCDEGANDDLSPGACRSNCKRARCGDGVVDPGEICDRPPLSDSVPGACRTDCTEPRCGDGVVDPGESCDSGPNRSDFEPDACRLSCTQARCGDNVVDTGEGCDTGMVVNGMMPNVCRANCVDPRCGDGVVDTGEACDDGNQSDADSCRNDCSAPSCGDAVLDPGEQCDDGNRVSGDSCQATCLLPVCGDGVRDADEDCDDGNLNENDGCRSRCELGCTDRASCSDLVFCNGAEECAAGVCRPGTPPTLDDNVACTTDRCDEDTDRVLHEGSDGACTATAAACLDGLRTSYASMCVAAVGCQEVPRTEACPDQSSSCAPGAGMDMLLTTYAPSCVGADCGAPAPTVIPCPAEPPSCDPASRVGIVRRATCDAVGERCGSEVAARNDCAALDLRSCSPDSLVHRTVTGQCTALGDCTTELDEEACAAPSPSCVTGVRTEYQAVCDAQAGCAPARALPGATCPIAAASCAGTGDTRTHVRFEPACADGSSCLPDGTAVRTDCAGRGPRCVAGTLTTYEPSCEPGTGCGAPATTGMMSCPSAAPVCAPSPEGFVHTRYAAGCADDAACSVVGTPTTTSCLGAPPACEQGVLTSFTASCQPATGCGQPIAAERTPCAAAEPVCTPSPEGFIHLRYSAACADGGRCAAQGTATMSVCAGNGQSCTDGVLTRMQASCVPATGCGVPTMLDMATCPVPAPSCAQVPNGWLHTAYAPACDGAADCAPAGRALQSPCITPPAVCMDAVITAVAATCDPVAGCGVAALAAIPCAALPSSCEQTPDGLAWIRREPACAGDGMTCVPDGLYLRQECEAPGSVCSDGVVTTSTASCDPATGCAVNRAAPTPCPAPASSCEPVADGFRYTTYRATCLDGESCVAGGVPSTFSCQAPGASCVNDVLTVSEPTCDLVSGCGVSVSSAVPCTAAPSTCEPVPGGFVYTRREPECLDGRSCVAGGVPRTENCFAAGATCVDGIRGGSLPDCTVEGGCAVIEQPRVPCPVAPPICQTDADGRLTHTTFSPGCADGASCDAQGLPQVTVCQAPAPVCRDGVYTSYEPSCSPDGGCAYTPVNSTCPSMPAACNFAPDGSYVDHYAASGGCNLEGTACNGGGAPIAQRCEDRPDFCDAGSQHTFALACTAGVGCSVNESTVACAASAAECDSASVTTVHRTFTAACNPQIPGTCYDRGVPQETTCAGGGIACAMQNNQVGLLATVGTCDPAAGCGVGPGVFTPCAVDGPRLSCEGDSRVEVVASCENANCATKRTVTPCPGEVTLGCDGNSRVTRTPSCTGEGVCGFREEITSCGGEATTTCEGTTLVSSIPMCTGAGVCDRVETRTVCPDGVVGCYFNQRSIAKGTCEAGACGFTSTYEDCPGAVTRECVYPSGDIGTLGVSVKGPTCGSGICTSGQTEFIPCNGESVLTCEDGRQRRRSPDCAGGNCTTSITYDQPCEGDDFTLCKGSDLYRSQPGCSSATECGQVESLVQACPYGCGNGACLDRCATVQCNQDPICEGNVAVVQTGMCDPATGLCNTTRTTCPLGCAGGRCRNCDPKQCPMAQSCSEGDVLVRRPGICLADGSCGLGEELATPCAEGEVCRNAACVADACAGVDCEAGKSCDGNVVVERTGTCSGGKCGESRTACPVHRACRGEGSCVMLPCETDCPTYPSVCEGNVLVSKISDVYPDSCDYATGLCSYRETGRTTCNFGCQNNRCNMGPDGGF